MKAKTYTIKPIEAEEDSLDEQSWNTADGTVIIICPSGDWSPGVVPEDDRYRVAVLDPDLWVWDDRFDLPSTAYPTFEAALAAANEIHRKAVEQFLESVETT
jgi:hypothetical protein